MIRKTLASCAAAAILAVFSPLHASVVVPLTLPQLTEAATAIVDGTVTEVRHVEGPSGIERVAVVRVASIWKGTTGETVYVRLPGGRVGRTETRVAGVPRIDEGERFVWFLGPHPRGGHVVIGLHQGALRAVADGAGRALVAAPGASAGPRGDVARVPREIEALADQVRRLVRSGEGR